MEFTHAEWAALAVAMECWIDEGCPLHYGADLVPSWREARKPL